MVCETQHLKWEGSGEERWSLRGWFGAAFGRGRKGSEMPHRSWERLARVLGISPLLRDTLLYWSQGPQASASPSSDEMLELIDGLSGGSLCP